MVGGRLAFGSSLPPPSQLELELPEHERRGRAPSCWQLFPCYLPDSCKPPDVCLYARVCPCVSVYSPAENTRWKDRTQSSQVCLFFLDPKTPLKPCLTHTRL